MNRLGRPARAESFLAAAMVLVVSCASNGDISFTPEDERVRNIVLKLARSHAAFELGEPHYDDASHLMIAPLISLVLASRAAD